MTEQRAAQVLTDDDIKTGWRRAAATGSAERLADPDAKDADGDDADSTDSDSTDSDSTDSDGDSTDSDGDSTDS